MSRRDAPEDRVYNGREAASLTGITYRQLDYWARTDLVRPSVRDATGSGSRRRYSYDDLLKLNLVRAMLDTGLKLESVRDVADKLASADRDAFLVLAGNDVIVAPTGPELATTLEHLGLVVTVLVLARLADDLAATVAENDALAVA